MKLCYLIVYECRKNTKTKNGKSMLLSNFAVCHSKKLRFIKDQETNTIMRSLAKSLSQIPLEGPISF